MKTELAIALDLPGSAYVKPVVTGLPDSIRIYKVGLEMFCTDGYAAVQLLGDLGKHVFLDLKLHDIPRTVARAVTAAASHHVQFLTLHAAGGREMMRAAAAAARDAGPEAPRLLAITMLTSLDRDDLREQAVERTPAAHVSAMAGLALQCGIDGVVCSAQEVGALRRQLGPDALLVTPGIRLPGDAAGDQKRVATPAAAVRDGASHLVVGRPILDAADPAAAARAVLADMVG